MERRFLSVTACPVRLEERGSDPPFVVGYAAVFHDDADPGTEYQLYDDLRERVMPGCFDRSLKEDDCRGLLNHSPDQLLGRMGAGTLKLSCDAKGLRYQIQPPDTQAGRDVCALIRRGDLTGSSFSFQARAVSHIRQKDGTAVRELRDVQVFDVGPVTFPAYASTSVGMRAVGGDEDARKAFEAWREEESRRRGMKTRVEVNARCAALGL